MSAARDAPTQPFVVAANSTWRDAAFSMTRAFEAAELPSPAIDARFLLQGILKCDAAALLRDGNTPVGAHAAALNAAIARRLMHEPVARILGCRAFYGRMFNITPDVLDPRPDTETLVDLVLDIVRADNRSDEAVTLADVGTGSGAIIATLLAELPHAFGVATDVSPAALSVASANAAALGVAGRLQLIETRGLRGVPGPIDVVVSNPPYIPSFEIRGLAKDVTAFDPELALDGGPDGLAIYREIARDISEMKGVRWVALEIGAGQHDDVEAIFCGHGAAATHRRRDLGGHVRAVAFRIQH